MRKTCDVRAFSNERRKTNLARKFRASQLDLIAVPGVPRVVRTRYIRIRVFSIPFPSHVHILPSLAVCHVFSSTCYPLVVSLLQAQRRRRRQRQQQQQQRAAVSQTLRSNAHHIQRCVSRQPLCRVWFLPSLCPLRPRPPLCECIAWPRLLISFFSHLARSLVSLCSSGAIPLPFLVAS